MVKKRICFLLLGLVCLLFVGCSGPEEIPVETAPPVSLRELALEQMRKLSVQETQIPVPVDPDSPADLAGLMRAGLYVRAAQESRSRDFPLYEEAAFYLSQAEKQNVMLPSQQGREPSSPVTRLEVLETLYRSAQRKGLTTMNRVEKLPDYSSEDPAWVSVSTMYRAGIWSGLDEYGTLEPDAAVTNRELGQMVARILHPEQRLSFTLEKKTAGKAFSYGTSGAGRDLMAYRYGEGENVLVVAFAIHGWEDSWDQDGQMLLNTAALLQEALEEHFEDLVQAKNWSVYVLPCLNPDGLYDGTTCNGPGRCTTWRLDRQGNLIEGGIDMNRCFPYHFYSSYSSRNFNGSSALQAVEAQAVAKLVEDVKGEGNNVLIDTHGWYSQIIVSGGWNCPIYEAFKTYFPSCYYTSLYGCSGYFSAWAAYVQGYDAALFEFPHVPNEEMFHYYELDQKYVDSILYLLENYES